MKTLLVLCSVFFTFTTRADVFPEPLSAAGKAQMIADILASDKLDEQGRKLLSAVVTGENEPNMKTSIVRFDCGFVGKSAVLACNIGVIEVDSDTEDEVDGDALWEIRPKFIRNQKDILISVETELLAG